MPKKMMMNINLLNNTSSFLTPPPPSVIPTASVVKPTNFKSGMINRIHTAKVGCGSCGR